MEDVTMENVKEAEEATPRVRKLDECLKLLSGESDEQRLVGLLVVTKSVMGSDLDAVRKVFDAIGFQFINRLIKTSGIGQEGKKSPEQRSYLHLALSILAAFCRVPELASLEETISKIPVLLDTLAKREHEPATCDCFEALLLIATASETGLNSIFMPKALPIVAHLLDRSPAETTWVPVAVKLLHCMLTRIAAEKTIMQYAQDLARVILPVAKQLCFQQDLTKFEALSVLYSLLVSDISSPVRDALGRSFISAEWAEHARTGLGQILHSRVAVEQKHIVLELSQAVVDVVGQTWLLGPMIFPGKRGRPHPDRFLLIMVEALRVETAVLLNEIAQMWFDPGPEAQTSDGRFVKERRLMSCFALLENVITIAAEQEEDDRTLHESSVRVVEEATLERTVKVVDEVIGLVIQLLEDAEEHNQLQGEILVACVRIASRYLAEAPSAHYQRCLHLLGFMFSVTEKADERSFEAMQFMIPFLSQITFAADGCRAFLFGHGHEWVAEYLERTMQNYSTGALVDIFDILLNVLAKENEVDTVNAATFASVLPTLTTAVEDKRLNDVEKDLAAAVCVSVLGLEREESLRLRPEVGSSVFSKIIKHIDNTVGNIAKSGGFLERRNQVADLWDLILAGCVKCVNSRPRLYPSLWQSLHSTLLNLLDDSRFSELSKEAVKSWPSFRHLVIVLELESRLDD